MEQEIDQVETSPEVIAEARQMGWVPQEEFRGDESKWRSADEFVERGREILPIVLKNKEELLHKNKVLENELKEIKAAMEDFKEYRKADKDRMYKQALSDLKFKKKEAVDNSDGEMVVAIDEAIDELKTEQHEVKEQPKGVAKEPVVDPEFMKWVNENDWYANNAVLQYAANAAGVEVMEEFPGLKGKPFLDKVTSKVRERYPEKFGNVRRESASSVEEGGNPAPRGSKKKTYANLPADAKAACDKFVKQGIMKQEEYVSEFEWD